MSEGEIDNDRLIGEIVRNSIKKWQEEKQSPAVKPEVVNEYHKYNSRKFTFILLCFIALIVCCGIALTIGQYDIGFFESYQILWQHITGNVQDVLKDYTIWELRLPKIIVGIIAGSALAICGVTMQSILKNPLADPYTTGVSSGAGFGATLAIVLGASIVTDEYSIVLNAFIFALIPTMAIIFVSKIKNASPTTMIMAGIAIMYIFNAMTTIIKLWGDPDSLSAVLEWQVGSIGGIEWKNIPVMLVITVIGFVIIQILSRKLNVLATGEDNAKALGVDVDNLRTLTMALVALVTATVVSFTGLIGFIGLVAPHISRIVIGADNRYLVPASALFGAALLIAADIVGKTIIAPAVLPVGVITAFLGGPLFLFLILRNKSEIWG
ncbi:FecCD family ABC transporter permease [Candidatus Methanomassiliicoccus intestinalis]|uniref:FecCD family ABC transporter permease n=1 Tax=Candidatus Methanomassiliicoccus intestinalis TaxID=1406512 RepID=UPI0037DDC3D1